MLMVELPCYARIKQTITDSCKTKNLSDCCAVEEDEIVLLQSLINPDWYQGQKLSGEVIKVAVDNCIQLIIPDLRSTELYFVVSFAEYSSTHHEDISFGKYTLIVVNKEVDENWSEGTVIGPNGKRLGRSGIFPKTFVCTLEVNKSLVNTSESVPVDTAKPILPFGVSPSTNVATGIKDSLVERQSMSTNGNISNECKPYAIAHCSFRGDDHGELGFKEGDVLYLRRYLEKGWIEGELNGKVGIFPATYVRVIVDLPGMFSLGGKPLRRVSRASTIGIASVLYDFKGREEDELTVDAGESVSVLELVNDEWARCYDPCRDHTGIIPASFLNIFMNEDDEEELSHAENLNSEMVSDGNSSRKPQLDAVSALPSCNRTELSAGQLSTFVSEKDGRDREEFTNSFFDTNSSPITFPRKLDNDAFLSKPKKPPPARPPPPKFSNISKTVVPFEIPPSRPVEVPKRVLLLPNPEKVSDVSAYSSSTEVETGVGNPDINSKNYVINDLISSELQYLSDIGMWEAEVLGSSNVTVEQKKMLTHGFPQLKELSRLLISCLVEQQSKPAEKQYFGEAFLSLRDEFTKTFGLYFRSVETITNAIVGKDAKLQRALNECVLEMRSLGSNLFDVPTAVSRPIQRCLKYPLFIGELIKSTPITHTDHPKLLEALKQMSLLASKMNESKRRKELAVKYRNIGTEPLKKRLSRLNMHSVKKKGNRFKYRLSAHIGLVHVEKDPVFDQLAEDLDRCERRICKLLHALQIYRQTILLQSKKYVETYTSTEKLAVNTDAINAEIRNYCRQLLQASSSLAQYLDDTLGMEAKKFLRLPITKVIQKRYDKLIDYVSAKNEDKNPDEIRLRQCDYEALNNQLKASLPKTIENIRKRTLTSVETIVLKDTEFFKTFSKLREGLSAEARKFLTVPFSAYAGSRDVRLHSFISINKAINADMFSSKKSIFQGQNISFKKQQSVGKESFLDTQNMSECNRQASNVPPLRPALPKVISIRKMEECESLGKNLIDLEDNLLDLATPIQSKQLPVIQTLDSSISSTNLLCDTSTGRTSGTPSMVSNSLSNTVDEVPLPVTADVLLNDLFPNEKDKSQVLSSLDTPLIPFRPFDSGADQDQCFDICLNRGASQLYPFLESSNFQLATSQDAENKPALPSNEVFSRKTVMHYYDKPIDNYALSNVFESGSVKPKDSSILQSGKNAIPVRSAPPPPSTTIYSTKLFEAGDPSLNQPWRAEFDFTGSADCHVSLSFGERVYVLKNHDDANNEEWWLVRKEYGGVGYVPASYLRVV